MTTPAYVYAGTVLSVHDGDTLTIDIDLGFDVHYRATVRLLGMNARELAMPGGPEARDHLLTLVAPGASVTVRSVHWDKFGGRSDAYVATAAGDDLSARMVADGYAAPWNGAGPRPVPPWPIPVP